MTKPFNIHDWQAKQRQQRLTENDDACNFQSIVEINLTEGI